MICRWAAIGWSLLGLLSLLPSLALAAESGSRPLRLALAPVVTPFARAHSVADWRAGHGDHGSGHGRRPARLDERQPSLGRRALLSVLESPELGAEDVAAATAPGDRFKFERQGSAARVVSRGYRDMCAKVSSKLWDDPAGRRVKFDIAGKPGVALVIPLH